MNVPRETICPGKDGAAFFIRDAARAAFPGGVEPVAAVAAAKCGKEHRPCVAPSVANARIGATVLTRPGLPRREETALRARFRRHEAAVQAAVFVALFGGLPA